MFTSFPPITSSVFQPLPCVCLPSSPHILILPPLLFLLLSLCTWRKPIAHWLPQVLHLRGSLNAPHLYWCVGWLAWLLCRSASDRFMMFPICWMLILWVFLLSVLFWVKNPFPLLYLQFLIIYLLHDPFCCQGFPLESLNWGIDIFNSILISVWVFLRISISFLNEKF